MTATFSGPKPSYLKFSKFDPMLAEDLSIARSILSLGIFADLAACIADLKRGFIAGSSSPNFAATVISFESLENNLDLCLSALPFLCLIPAQ